MKRVVKKIISICSVVATVASVSTAISVGVTHYQQMSDSQSSAPIQSTPGEIRNYRTYDSDAQ
jgi:negative regulator of sigma E activity